MNYEEQVIDPLLTIIKDHQLYLTEKDNLPQLAKLGFMYEFLYFAGRVCYGYEGEFKKGYECEDNPKYKIEMCEPINDEIDNLIYDAWGMHVRDNYGENFPNWIGFKKMIYEGRELSEFEKKGLKPNKTFEEWVDYLTDSEYRYSSLYLDRRSVANHLLCVIGNGYGYKNGYVYEEASGADQDVAIYGDWENAEFGLRIKDKIDDIMRNPIVEKVVDKTFLWYAQKQKEKIEREKKENKRTIDLLAEIKKIIEDLKKQYGDQNKKIEEIEILLDPAKRAKKYFQYYPICNYSIITMFDVNTEQSYIKAGLEVCREILAHEDEERKENIEFARKFIKKFQK